MSKQNAKDLINEGGSAPGGTAAFPEAAHQWSTSNAANRNNYPSGSPNIDPMSAWKMAHYGLKDESPAEKGDVPVHPGLAPRLFRTARDANYDSPDGRTPGSYREQSGQRDTDYQVPKSPSNDGPNNAIANDGHMASPDGRHRGQSPEVLKQSRGQYRP